MEDVIREYFVCCCMRENISFFFKKVSITKNLFLIDRRGRLVWGIRSSDKLFPPLYDRFDDHNLVVHNIIEIYISLFFFLDIYGGLTRKTYRIIRIR